MNARKLFIRTAAAAGALSVAATLMPTSAGAAGWLATENVSLLAGIPAEAKVAVADNGHAFAVWRAKSGDHYRVYTADRKPGGAWSQPTPLSMSTKDAFTPDIAVNKDRDLVVSWRLYENPNMHLQLATRESGASWKYKTVGPADEYVTDPEVEIDDAGTVHAAWGTTSGIVRATTYYPDQGLANLHTIAFEKPLGLDLGIREDGRTTVLWAEATADPEVDKVKSVSFSPGSFGSVQTLDSEDVVGDVSLSVNESGVHVASYTIKNGLQGLFATAVRGFDGVWQLPETLSDNGENAVSSQPAVDGSGNAVVAWHTQEGALQVVTRGPGDSDWSGTVDLATTNSPGAPTLAMNDRGDAAVIWGNSQPGLAISVRKAGASSFSSAPTLASGALVLSNRDVALDAQGNVTVVTGVKANQTQGRVISRTYDMAGPFSKLIEPNTKFYNGPNIPLVWSANDRLSEVSSVDVLRRIAPYDGEFGGVATYLDNSTKSDATFPAKPGHTYCFFTRAVDTLGNLGEDSAYRCTAAPVDDRTPTATGSWTKAKGSAWYEDTIRVSQQKGATLRLEDVNVSKLSLLVAKGPGNGSVAVFFNGEKLQSFSLASKKLRILQELYVTQFDVPTVGDVVIKVTSAGKPVRIDGIQAFQELQIAK